MKKLVVELPFVSVRSIDFADELRIRGIVAYNFFPPLGFD